VLLLLAAIAAGEGDPGEWWDKPRRETFDLKGAWPAAVVEEIRTRFGIPFEFQPAGGERADFVAKDVTFLEALDRCAASYGLSIVGVALSEEERDFGQAGLALVRPDPPLPPAPVSHAGPSRLSVQMVSVLKVRRCAAEDPQPEESVWCGNLGRDEKPHLRLQFRWITEPRFKEAEIIGWRDTCATDDRGNAIGLLDAPDLPVPANSDFEQDLAAPHESAKAIGRLAGVLRVALAAERTRIEFATSDAPATKPLGGGSITLGGVNAAKPDVSFTVIGNPCRGLPREGDDEFDIRIGSEDWVDRGVGTIELYAYDADGREIARGSSCDSSSALWGSSWTYRIDLEQAPARIAFEATTRVVIREAPFEFTNIPLPE
jgi:hypothetical protein